jgi:hypothetical protein
MMSDHIKGMTMPKASLTDKKKELEARILKQLSDNMRACVSLYIKDNNTDHAWMLRRDILYREIDAGQYGHAGVFNEVLSELKKAGLVLFSDANYAELLVRLCGWMADDIATEILSMIPLSSTDQGIVGSHSRAFEALCVVLTNRRGQQL